MNITEINLNKFPAQRNRISSHQKFILDTEFTNYCLTSTQLLPKELTNIFTKQSKAIIDIGFGNGEQLLPLCESMPTYTFIGIELYKKGIANLIKQIKHKNLTNIKIIYGEAKETLQKIYDHSISKIQIFFPDPWPKRKHHKRRLIQKDFINIIKNKLLINGILHIATDSDAYAAYIIKIMTDFPEFDQPKNTAPYLVRPTTKFEKIGISLGHKIWDLVFVLKSYI
ncbi:MAG: tRNA (guanosine(46)-N7)-methyltransferase TrmB [Gammaproteobacteria bacterium]